MRAAFALRIISGIIIYNFGIAERLRTLRYPIFTGRVWNEPSQALPRQLPRRGSQAVSPVAKVSDTIRNLPATQKAPPFGGAGIEQSEMTERASPLKFCKKLFPQRRAFAESGAANAVSRYDPSRENSVWSGPQAATNAKL